MKDSGSGFRAKGLEIQACGLGSKVWSYTGFEHDAQDCWGILRGKVDHAPYVQYQSHPKMLGSATQGPASISANLAQPEHDFPDFGFFLYLTMLALTMLHMAVSSAAP